MRGLYARSRDVTDSCNGVIRVVGGRGISRWAASVWRLCDVVYGVDDAMCAHLKLNSIY